MEPGVVGFRFRPTQGELLSHHLKRKLQKSNYDEGRCVIPELNIYDHIPRELLAIYNEKSCEKSTSSDSYFFCPRDKVDTKKKRKAGGGYWKETSTKRCIEDEETGEVIGIKRIFSFYEGNQSNACKTELALHEYHLNASIADETIPNLTAFALCHVKEKKQRKKASKPVLRSSRASSVVPHTVEPIRAALLLLGCLRGLRHKRQTWNHHWLWKGRLTQTMVHLEAANVPLSSSSVQYFKKQFQMPLSLAKR